MANTCVGVRGLYGSMIPGVLGVNMIYNLLPVLVQKYVDVPQPCLGVGCILPTCRSRQFALVPPTVV